MKPQDLIKDILNNIEKLEVVNYSEFFLVNGVKININDNNIVISSISPLIENCSIIIEAEHCSCDDRCDHYSWAEFFSDKNKLGVALRKREKELVTLDSLYDFHFCFTGEDLG